MHLLLQETITSRSWLARIPGSCKLVLVLVFSCLLFVLPYWEFLLALCALVLLAALSLRKDIKRLLKPLTFAAPFLLVLSLVYLAGAFALVNAPDKPVSGLFALQSHVFTPEATGSIAGMSYSLYAAEEALYYLVRIVVLILLSQCFVISTNFDKLFESLRQSCSFFDRLGLNLRPLFAALSLSIRFIPVFFIEMQELKNAQLARGAKFEGSSLMQALKVYQALFLPLIVRLFMRADTLALAFDARLFMPKNR